MRSPAKSYRNDNLQIGCGQELSCKALFAILLAMKEFNRLITILSELLGPNGCPWDQKQTLASIRRHLIEEAYEVIEAINDDDRDKIVEELGDIFMVVVFLSKLAEKEKKASISEILNTINEKLIRRHPHVYGEAQIDNPDQVVEQWEKIKSEEKPERKSKLDGIPKDLPSILRAQKVCKTFQKADFTPPEIASKTTELSLGLELYKIINQCQSQGIDADIALRQVLSQFEQSFRNS